MANLGAVVSEMKSKAQAQAPAQPAPVEAPETGGMSPEAKNYLYQALIGFAPVLLGGLVGGAEGGAAGAQAGQKGLSVLEEQKKESETKEKEKKLAEKEAKKEKFEAAKYASEQALKQKELGLKEKEILAKSGEMAPKIASELRTERLGLPLTKRTQEVSESFNRIVEVAEKPSAAGDLALIFNYMKMLDPGSVVRETEFQNAAQARAWLSRANDEKIPVPAPVKQAVQKLASGKLLLPEQRADFTNQALNTYNAQMAVQNNLDRQYVNLAQKRGVAPEDVIFNFSPESTKQRAMAMNQPSPEFQQVLAQVINQSGNQAMAAPQTPKPDFKAMDDATLMKYLGR